MKNNFVAKHDHNRSSIHKDLKKTYKPQLDKEFIYFDEYIGKEQEEDIFENIKNRLDKDNQDFKDILYLLSHTISEEEYRRVEHVFTDAIL